MRKVILFHFCLMLTFNGNTQNDSTISIGKQALPLNYQNAMRLEAATPEQVDSMIYLSINYSYKAQDSCLQLGEKSVELGKSLKEPSIYARALLELGDSYRIFGKKEEAEYLLMNGKKIYEDLQDTAQLAYANNKLGALFTNKGDNATALAFYLQALESWEILKDSQNIFKPYLNIAWIFYRLNQLEKSQEYNDKAYEIATALADKRAISQALNNRGIYLSALRKKYIEKADTSANLKEMYLDTASIFRDVILETYEASLAIARDMDDLKAQLRCIINISDIRDEMGEHTLAVRLGLEAEKIGNQVGDVAFQIMNYCNLAEATRHLSQFRTSVNYAEKALDLAHSNDMAAYITAAHNELHPSYKALGMYDKSLNSLEHINRYIRTTNEKSTAKAIADAEARYQNIKKENELLDRQNQILTLEQKNASIKKQKNTLIGSGIGLLLLGMIGFRMDKMRKDRNDKKAFAEALIYAQEEERKRIARDLHDGVGQTLLLIKKQMEARRDSDMENQRMIGETLEEVRAISRDLHPFQLEKFGLNAALTNMIEKVGHSTKLFLTKEISLDGIELDSATSLTVYRVVQEAINNIVKHSRANAARIELVAKEGVLEGEIRDNGNGFDHEIKMIDAQSLGLRTMQERVVAKGGVFRIGQNKPNGTVIRFSIPLK